MSCSPSCRLSSIIGEHAVQHLVPSVPSLEAPSPPLKHRGKASHTGFRGARERALKELLELVTAYEAATNDKFLFQGQPVLPLILQDIKVEEHQVTRTVSTLFPDLLTIVGANSSTGTQAQSGQTVFKAASTTPRVDNRAPQAQPSRETVFSAYPGSGTVASTHHGTPAPTGGAAL